MSRDIWLSLVLVAVGRVTVCTLIKCIYIQSSFYFLSFVCAIEQGMAVVVSSRIYRALLCTCLFSYSSRYLFLCVSATVRFLLFFSANRESVYACCDQQVLHDEYYIGGKDINPALYFSSRTCHTVGLLASWEG